MSNPNINVWGATYNGVTGVTLPTSGGGTATFPWVEGSETKTQNGTYDVTSLAEVVVNVSGGGASNFISGTFTGTSAGAMSITLPYTGSGYPVMAAIYPTEGQYNPNTGSFYNLVQKYVICSWFMSKSETDTTPTYQATGDRNRGTPVVLYKGSSATGRSYTSSNTTIVYSSNNATESANGACKFNSATSMSVYIANASYGFAQNIEYTYDIVYSS